MKNKKKIGMIVFGIVCAIIVAICIIIQVVIKNEGERLEEELKKYETLSVETKSGSQIETEYIHIEDEKFYIKVPTTFRQLDYETISKKYSGDMPNVVFSNDETTINIAVSITDNQMKDNQIKEFTEYTESLLKENSEIISTNFYKVDNHNIGQTKLISEASDSRIYNNMISFSYNDKLVIVAFNCTENLKDEWENVGDFIIDSLFFVEE